MEPQEENWKWKKYFFTTLLILIIVLSAFALDTFGNFGADSTGKKIAEELSKLGTPVEYQSAQKGVDTYKMKFKIQGQDYEFYVSEDGKLLFMETLDVEKATQVASAQAITKNLDVPKSDRPEVEIFVMSHCPYGTQMEKGIIPAVEALNGKVKFDIKFVYYAMHGEIEVQEQLRQFVIKTQMPEKYIPYLKCFLQDGNSDRCMTENELSKQQIENYMNIEDKKFDISKNFNDKSLWLGGQFPLINFYKQDNEKYNVQGSPTLVINGAVVESARDSQSLLNAMCSGFNNKPEECDAALSTVAPSPGFGSGTTSDTSSNIVCGV